MNGAALSAGPVASGYEKGPPTGRPFCLSDLFRAA